MASDETPNAPAPRDRREVVREKAQQVHAQQSKARVARRISAVAVIVAVVAATAIVVTWAVSSTAAKPQLSPANMTNDGIRVEVVGAVGDSVDTGEGALAEASASPTPTPTPTVTETADAAPESVDITVYVDYLSPGVKQFQLANASQLADWVSQGAATLTYHPVALLTPKSNGTKYSLRSAGAAACVATYAPDTFYSFNQSLLERQPAIDTDGFADSELAAMAIASGAADPKRVRSCIEGQDFVSWVQDATERALAGSLPGTDDVTLTGAPLVLVNGQAYVGALDDPKEFSQFVLTLSSHAYYTSTPTPTAVPVTPTPTPTN
ncbi:MAG TPA: thioredoxin domain-containing protein [Microbacterium sp.]|nr:thioredoxin domain-containing protein [Microbacterium sp.]